MKKSYLLLLLPLLLFSLSVRAVVRTVDVSNFQFSPATLAVNVGDTIRWIWVNGTHTTTSLVIPPTAAAWDSPIRQSAQTFMYKVTVPGVYNYVCTPHAPNQAGTFTAAAVSGVSGVVTAEPAFVLKGSVVSDEFIINLDIVQGAQVNIQLYNLVGRLVRTYSDSRREAGTYQDTYPVSDLPKGLYLLAVKVGKQQTTRRLIVQ